MGKNNNDIVNNGEGGLTNSGQSCKGKIQKLCLVSPSACADLHKNSVSVVGY